MVRERRTIPPVYPLALAGLGCFYTTLRLMPNHMTVLLSLCALVLFLMLAYVYWSLPTSEKKIRSGIRLLILSVVMGAISGITAYESIQLEHLPVKTLAELSKSSSVTVQFLNDPSPYGPKWYRVNCRILSLSINTATTFSGSGRCIVYLPTALVKASCPGQIGATKNPVLFSEGLITEMNGRFSAHNRTCGEVFFASSVNADKKSWSTGLAYLRAFFRLSLTRILYDWKDPGGFLNALLSGNRDYLSPKLENDFRRTGLTHILALSGTHLSLMALVAVQIGKRAGGKRVSIWFSTLAILVFVWFAGLSPSLSRSLMMALIMTALQCLGFPVAVLPILAVSAFLQMMIAPDDAVSLAYVLSYAALFGILTAGEKLRNVTQKYIPSMVGSSLSTSIGAQLLTTPVLTLFIGTISPIGIIASCLVELPSSVYLVSGMLLACTTAIFPATSSICAGILGLQYTLIAGIVAFFAGCDPLSIQGMPATITVILFSALSYLLIMLMAFRCEQRRSINDSFARL